MASDSDDLEQQLRENLKLRRELAAEVAQASDRSALQSSWRRVLAVVTLTVIVAATLFVIWDMQWDNPERLWGDARRKQIEQRARLRAECHSTEEYKNYQHHLRLAEAEESRIYAEKVSEAKRRYCQQIRGLGKYRTIPSFCFPERDRVYPAVDNPCRDLEPSLPTRTLEELCHYGIECPTEP